MYFCDLSHSEGIRKCMLSILKFWHLSYHMPVSAFYPPLLATFASNQGQEVFNRDETWLGKKILGGSIYGSELEIRRLDFKSKVENLTSSFLLFLIPTLLSFI